MNPSLRPRVLAIAFGGYLTLALYVLYVTAKPASIALFWYANAFGALVLLARPRRDWPQLLGALWLAVFVANWIMRGLGAITWMSPFANLVEISVSAWILQRYFRPVECVTSVGRLAGAMALGGVAPALLGAVISSSILALVKGAPFSEIWFSWFLGSAIGAVSVLPLGLLVLARGGHAVIAELGRPRTALIIPVVVAAMCWGLPLLPFPFTYVSLVLTVAAACGGLAMAAVGGLLCSVVLGALIAYGRLQPDLVASDPSQFLFYLPIGLSLVTPSLLAAAIENITEKASQLDEQRELLHVTLQSIGDAVISTDTEGRVVSLNPVAEQLTGWWASEAEGCLLPEVFRIVNGATGVAIPDPVAECLAHGRAVSVYSHTVLIARDGTEYGIEDSAAPIRSTTGAILGVVLVFRDCSEQRRLASEVSYRATHDALTGLLNRSEFETRLLRALHRAQADQSGHALLYLDLDQFKLVNDACGHTVGDQVLQQVSRILGEAIRGRDTLARLGGDEFAIILDHCTSEQAGRTAQIICDRMEESRFVHQDRRFRIGASIGLVPIDHRWSTTAAIMQAADTACYAAKEAGRNRVHVWCDSDAAMRARHFEMQWASRIERALDEHGFALFAQRIEALATPAGGLHAEVLVRMKDYDGGHILPGAFMAAAERFHLASRVDRWVLRQALQWMKSLPSLEMLDTLCVNLSGQSVGDPAFHAWASEHLDRAGPEVCARLCLEITETAAITHLADAASFIAMVHAAGVKVALDDFGSGASSFGYLKQLSVDYLKIDGSFIQGLIRDPLDDAAVRCFVDVAKVVGVRTVAEFVDRPEILERLRQIGIDYAQGFLIHRPEAISALLELPVVVDA